MDMTQRMLKLGQVFRPAGPVDSQDLFKGRLAQLARVNSVIHEMSRHGLVYGERGVGKTSLAVVSMALAGDLALCMRLNCDVGDNYASIWEKVIDKLILAVESDRHDAEALRPKVERSIEILHADTEISPARVTQALEVVSTIAPIVIFIDEFDRVKDRGTRTLFSDTIKALSDDLVRATLILVGVADDVESLIGEHASIVRNLRQIQMPTMLPTEIFDIIEAGFQAVELQCDPSLMHVLVHLPQGLPAYAHQLAQSAAERAVLSERYQLSAEDIEYSIKQAVQNADESMIRAYLAATVSAQRNLFETVLLAAALAPVDATGYFAPADLREPLRKITGEDWPVDRFGRHLVQFCDDNKHVLERRGGERKWRYRFIEPMMRPYVIMRALDSGVTLDVLSLAPATEPGRLFELVPPSPQA